MTYAERRTPIIFSADRYPFVHINLRFWHVQYKCSVRECVCACHVGWQMDEWMDGSIGACSHMWAAGCCAYTWIRITSRLRETANCCEWKKVQKNTARLLIAGLNWLYHGTMKFNGMCWHIQVNGRFTNDQRMNVCVPLCVCLCSCMFIELNSTIGCVYCFVYFRHFWISFYFCSCGIDCLNVCLCLCILYCTLYITYI